MSNPITSAADRVVVITHVQPTGTVVGVTTPHSLGQTVSTKLARFRLGHPKALGTVQIMIAVVMLLIGITMASSPLADNIGVLSGFFVWGSITYVIAGSLTVAADNHLNQCLVKGSLGMNVVAAFVSFVGIILYSLDSGGVLLHYFCYPSYQNNDNLGQSANYNQYSLWNTCTSYWTRSEGISGVLVTLSLLEFIVSICVSSFGCKATCQCCRCCQCCYTPEQVIIVGEQMLLPQVGTVIPNPARVLTNYETANYPKEPGNENTSAGFPQYNLPPQYTVYP